MSIPVSKRSKESANIETHEMDVSKEAKSIIDKILGDVSKTSATKQIVIGTASGWATGFLTMKVGKVVAFAVGGGIIILQVAAHQGYIKINWDKVQKKADKITDKVEEKITGEGPKFMDKVERFVDKKLDKAEQLLKNGESRTRRWYHSLTGEETFRPKEIHFFLASFAAGLAIGFATADWVADCYILNVSKRARLEDKKPLQAIDLVDKKKLPQIPLVTDEFDTILTEMRSKFEEILQWINDRVREIL